MQKGFLYPFFSDTDFFSKILIFFLIYTDFVLDQSGRSAYADVRERGTDTLKEVLDSLHINT